MHSSRSLATLAYIAVSLAGCASSQLQLTDLERIRSLVNQQSQTELDRYRVFQAPSYPRVINRLYTEWDKMRYLVVSIPPEISRDTLLRTFISDIIERSIQYTSVLVLVDESRLEGWQRVINLLREKGLDRRINSGDSNEIRILPTSLETMWVRDYGPIFAMDNDGALVILDPMYRDIRTEATGGSTIPETISDYGRRSNDDAIPAAIASALNTELGSDVSLIRPPFQLWGGDFQIDGSGNAFTSSSTLTMNGGNKEDMNLIFQYYFGINKVTYLEPLPGPVIKHIDMFFKVVDDRIFLLGEYLKQPLGTSSSYKNFIQSEANRVLEHNASLLRKKFPDRKIIRIPMPELYIPEDSTTRIILSEIVERAIAKEINGDSEYDQRLSIGDLMQTNELDVQLALRKYLRRKGVPTYDVAESDIEMAVVRELHDEVVGNVVDISIDGISTLREYIEQIRTFIARRSAESPSTHQYIYRTYLNSTVINGTNGQMILVPSYRNCSIREELIKELYKEAYPNAVIEFINSDAVIGMQGAVHCVTGMIPVSGSR